MATKETTSTAPFVVVAVLLLGIMGYLGWRLYDAPADEEGAALVATRATEVVARPGGGDASVCATMRDVAVTLRRPDGGRSGR